MRIYKLAKGLKILVILVFGLLVFGFVVEQLWNWLIPGVFGWRPIDFIQALGLLVLCRILFGGFHRHGGHGHWRHRMQERWARMSPEERERFRAGMRNHHGFGWWHRDEASRVDDVP